MTAPAARTNLTLTLAGPALMALVLVLVLGALGLGSAPPAGAHEGPGILTVETDEPTPTGHRYVIRLVWENDRHPAARDTTVTATAYDPSGAPQTPIPMTPVDDDGRFEATVDMARPGSWRVQFASVDPVATVDHPAEVAAPATTTTAAPPSSAPAAGGAAEAGDEAGTGDDRAPATGEAAPRQDTGDGGNGGSGGALVAALVVVVLLVAGTGTVLYLRRRPPGTGHGPSSPTSGVTGAEGRDGAAVG